MASKKLITPSQTVGPFFHPTLLRVDAAIADLVPEDDDGAAITISGVVLDGEGQPVPDAGIEIWQADEEGRYFVPENSSEVSPNAFIGYGRVGTDDAGEFQFRTLKPGPVAFDSDRLQAPHICVTIYARGLLNHLVTRIYFDDEPSNDSDPVMRLVPEERRRTLIARRKSGGGNEVFYRFDIVLQGDRETVFFNV